jgi:hypothetical protein
MIDLRPEAPALLRLVGVIAGLIVWALMMRRYKAYWAASPTLAQATQGLRWYARGAGAMVCLLFFILSAFAGEV